MVHDSFFKTLKAEVHQTEKGDIFKEKEQYKQRHRHKTLR